MGLCTIAISHVADIELESDEMVTFTGTGGHEYDVVRKSWGYYATPSVDRRLRSFGLRAGLMRNIDTRHCFVVLVHEDQLDDWRRYMDAERQELIVWLDEMTESDTLLQGGTAG